MYTNKMIWSIREFILLSQPYQTHMCHYSRSRPSPKERKNEFFFFWGEVAVTHADSLTSLVSLVAVPVNASTGTKGDELICKDTSICKCKVSSTLVV